MSVENQVAKLEALLGKIRGNAARPRATVEAAPAPAAPIEEAPLESALEMPLVELEAQELPVTLAENEIPEPEQVESAPAEVLDEIEEDLVEELPVAEADLEEADLTEFQEELEEPVPESAPRPAQAAQAQAAQADADQIEELDLEPPVKTPPPESGRQVMSPVSPVPVPVAAEASGDVAVDDADFSELGDSGAEADLTGGDDVDSLLEADLTGAPISKAPPGGPTMEQLGETVELEGADGPDAHLELSEPPGDRSEAAPDDSDDMELALPGKEFQGGYDASLAPPDTALADLDRIRTEQERAAAPATAVTFSAPPSGPMSAPPSASASGSEVAAPEASGPIVIGRPASAPVYVAEMITAKPVRTPATFLELLDQSLSL